MTADDAWASRIPAVLLLAGAVFGAGAGLVIAPGAVAIVLLTAVLQAGVAIVWWRGAPPLLLATMVTVVALAPLLDADLRTLVALGAMPWVTVAQAFATQHLVSYGRSVPQLIAGFVILAPTVVAAAAIAIVGGTPAVAAVLAATVPVLGGCLVATTLRLADAQRDRLRRDTRPAEESAPELTERERSILRRLATGGANAVIARDLYLSEATVKGHVSRLMRRFGCGNRTQLALKAARWFD